MEKNKKRLRELLTEWKDLKLRLSEVDALIFSVLEIDSYKDYCPENKMNVIIACAGKGTRFKTEVPKIIFKINGKMVIEYINNIIREYVKKIYIIVSKQNYSVINRTLKPLNLNAFYVIQKELLGDGDAVYQIKNYLKDTSGDSLILWGDAIYKKEAVQRMIAIHQIFHNDFTCLTDYTKNPYAGFSRDCNGKFLSTFHQRIGKTPKMGENDCSFFVCDTQCLLKYLETMHLDYEFMSYDIDIGEMYFIHILDYMKKDDRRIELVCCKQENDVLEFNTVEEAKEIEKFLKTKNLS